VAHPARAPLSRAIEGRDSQPARGSNADNHHIICDCQLFVTLRTLNKYTRCFAVLIGLRKPLKRLDVLAGFLAYLKGDNGTLSHGLKRRGRFAL